MQVSAFAAQVIAALLLPGFYTNLKKHFFRLVVLGKELIFNEFQDGSTLGIFFEFQIYSLAARAIIKDFIPSEFYRGANCWLPYFIEFLKQFVLLSNNIHYRISEQDLIPSKFYGGQLSDTPSNFILGLQTLECQTNTIDKHYCSTTFSKVRTHLLMQLGMNHND